MGEAKRRKKLDPRFGVAPSIELCDSASRWQASIMEDVTQGRENLYPAQVQYRDAEWEVVCTAWMKNGKSKLSVVLVFAKEPPFSQKQIDNLCASAAQQILEAADVAIV